MTNLSAKEVKDAVDTLIDREEIIQDGICHEILRANRGEIDNFKLNPWYKIALGLARIKDPYTTKKNGENNSPKSS